MALDPQKVAPRTLFEAEARKAEKLYKRWLNAVMKLIKRVIAKATSSADLIRRLRAFGKTKAFRAFCKQQARQIVTMLAVGQQRSWRQAASLSSNGRRIFLALQKELKQPQIGGRVQQIIDNNAKLIQTVPQNIAKQFVKMASEKQFAGLRPEELLDEFKKRAPHLTDVQARRIARTESGKAAAQLLSRRQAIQNLLLMVEYSLAL